VGTVGSARGSFVRAAVLSAALAATVAGLMLPFLVAPDCPCGLTAAQEERLKDRARSMNDLPALRLQIEHATAPTSDPDAVVGRVARRAPFAIKVGEILLTDRDIDNDTNTAAELFAWSLVLVPAVAAAAIAAHCLIRS